MILTGFVYPMCLVPDTFVPWARLAAQAAEGLLRSRSFDLVYASMPPYSAGLAAIQAGSDAHVPVVLDFRDLWVSNHYEPPRFRRRKHHALEAWAVFKAAHVICATQGFGRSLTQRFPDMDRRTTAIYNGFDSSIPLEVGAPALKQEGLRIVYAGSLYRQYRTAAFFAGLQAFRTRHREVDVSMRFIGGLDAASHRVAVSLGLGDIISLASRRGIRATLAETAASDCSLALLAGSGDLDVVPAKIFDALSLSKPVLFIGPETGEARGILSAAGLDYRADPNDPGDCLGAIERLWHDKSAGRPKTTVDPSYIASFDMRCQIASFGEVFERAVSRSA